VTELNESIYIWHDASGRAPMWEVPDGLRVLGDHIHDRDYFPVGPEARIKFAGIHVHPQIIAENAVDPHHFRFVHKTPVSPTVLRENTDDITWSAKVGFGRRWSDGADTPGETTNTLEIYWSGLGIAFNGEHTREGFRVIAICATPVDDTTSDIFSTYWIDEASGNYEERLKIAQAALPDDIAIWDHQIYLDPPGLTASEAAGFTQLRNWADGFYPDSVVGVANPTPSGVR
jgi:phenylpropionate dioxygenase-like ring-hydroxylating dioxygenase large terminal subunit